MSDRILVAEDNESLRVGVVDALEDAGYTVTAAPNGEEALRALDTEAAHVVVSDIPLGDISGGDVLREAKEINSDTEDILMRLERLKSELNLTAEQQSKMDMIIQSSRAEIQEIRGKSKPEEASIRIRALIRQKIWGILTQEQRKKLSEMGQVQQKEQGRPARVWTLSQRE